MITQAMAVFIEMLNASPDTVKRLAELQESDNLVADWMQACWEMVVEGSLPRTSPPARLVVYGDGADCYPQSSRISFPEDLPTHEVVCKPIGTNAADVLSGTKLQ